MTPVEAQFLFTRTVLLLVLYTFLAGVAWLAWLDLRGSRGQAKAAESVSVPPSRLIVLDGATSGRVPGTALPLEAVSTVGRDLDNEVVLVDQTVSGHHAVIHLGDGAWWIEDLHSTNGTFVNGERLAPEAPAIVRSGDVVQIGAVRLRLVSPEL